MKKIITIVFVLLSISSFSQIEYQRIDPKVLIGTWYSNKHCINNNDKNDFKIIYSNELKKVCDSSFQIIEKIVIKKDFTFIISKIIVEKNSGKILIKKAANILTIKGVYNHKTLTFLFNKFNDKNISKLSSVKLIDLGKGYITIKPIL